MDRKPIEKALSEYFTNKLQGKVLCMWDEQKRAYSIHGEGLPAHPDLRHQYPNGWSMLDYVKPTEAKKLVAAHYSTGQMRKDGTWDAARTPEHGGKE